ncbi:uncharacterized protein E0L32_002095 [Thyridium curvatum]|uniref:DUF7708 domain-containing protein n=1 Tax=Thyridium curvatum TaxID=1093900 RepID=A0A507AFQ3_9PEZI|nr:uncharacterized protein E0L32_002038 [Thyridium curvatum]XP_030989203.1 uncharacterized protein E0L32_002095 [Thyridium curvatum]TPX07435.1 hypothetical protein E0L32_002038 [Thyridium curvatum]TPX07492.1 hypothetical protein E0L32_002095 [Thyridium curvatum]
MTDQTKTRETKSLVRAYSMEAPARSSLDSHGIVLGEVLNSRVDGTAREDIAQPWRRFFEPQQAAIASEPTITILSVEATKLRNKWLEHYHQSTKEEKADLGKYEPSIESVSQMIKDMLSSWQGKRTRGIGGSLATKFHRFCNTLNGHRSLLKLLPEGNEYVSLFTGALTSLVQASVNHERIADSLVDSLCLISENIEEASTELQLFPIDSIQAQVADLYSHIFLFFSTVLDWLMKKRIVRILNSFNENVAKRFEEDIVLIKSKSAALRNSAAQSSRAELRATRLSVEEMGRDLRMGFEGEARHLREKEYYDRKLEHELREARKDLREQGKRFERLLDYTQFMLQHVGTGFAFEAPLPGKFLSNEARRPHESFIVHLDDGGRPCIELGILGESL